MTSEEFLAQYGVYLKRLTKWAAAPLGRPDLFKDMHQEVVMVALHRLKSWKPGKGSSPLSWTTINIRDTVWGVLRKSWGVAPGSDLTAPVFPLLKGTFVPDVEGIQYPIDDVIDLRTKLSELKDTSSVPLLFVWAANDGKDLDQLSEVVNRRRHTVHHRIHRLLNELSDLPPSKKWSRRQGAFKAIAEHPEWTTAQIAARFRISTRHAARWKSSVRSKQRKEKEQ